MHSFFTLIYIKTNRFSDEKFCVGILANINGVPYFGYSKSKMTIALNYVNKDSGKNIKRSFNLLEKDVNKIINGEEALSLFDVPYSKKILEKLTLKKRGIVQYSDLFELNGNLSFDRLYSKFIGETWNLKRFDTKKEISSLKKRFYTFVDTKKYNSFKKKYKMLTDQYPSIYIPLIVDLVKKDSFYIVFHTIDFSKSMPTIQRELNKFRLMRQSFSQKSDIEGLSKGRYYLVYEGQNDPVKREIINKIKNNSIGFQLLLMSEMGDKL